MTTITLTRTKFHRDGIFGGLWYDTFSLAQTLEHAYQIVPNGPYEPKVPDGIYTCRRKFSERFKCDVFELRDVPGCQNIEIHFGNFNKDSEGCILLGEKVSQYGSDEMLTNSKVTFDKFMEALSLENEFQLEVKREV